MKVRSSSFIFTVAAFALTATFPTQAATITWGPAQNITGDTDVSTNGTLVGAVNMTGLNPFLTSPTVNGVTFTGAAVTVTTSSGIFSWGQLAGHLGVPGDPGQFGALSADYRDFLRLVTGGSDFTLTMSGLTPGTEYEFQWWSNTSFTNFGPSVTLAIAGNSVSLDGNPGNTLGGLGQFAIGTFIADASTQQIQFSKTLPLQLGANVNGFQLRDLTPVAPVVPEPGTALFGLGLLGTALLHRRR